MKNTQKLLLETKQKEEYTLFFLLFFFFYSFFFPKWFVQLLFTTDHLTCSSLWWQKTNQKLTGILKCDLYYTWSLNLQSKSLDSDLQLLLFPDVSKFSSARSTWILLSSKIGQKSSSRQKKKKILEKHNAHEQSKYQYILIFSSHQHISAAASPSPMKMPVLPVWFSNILPLKVMYSLTFFLFLFPD